MSEHFFHGTTAKSALSIMQSGFNIGEETNGRAMGTGLYITTEINFAPIWGDVLIKCHLVEGARILWQTEPDKQVLKYLVKEFGSKILDFDFYKAVPHNKQLTHSEIVNIFHYLLNKQHKNWKKAKAKDPYHWYSSLSRIYKYLKVHRYDGVGSRDLDWAETFIFNPSRVVAVSAHKILSYKIGESWLAENLKLSDALNWSDLQTYAKLEEEREN